LSNLGVVHDAKHDGIPPPTVSFGIGNYP
jgi:hypothetical protein